MLRAARPPHRPLRRRRLRLRRGRGRRAAQQVAGDGRRLPVAPAAAHPLFAGAQQRRVGHEGAVPRACTRASSAVVRVRGAVVCAGTLTTLACMPPASRLLLLLPAAPPVVPGGGTGCARAAGCPTAWPTAWPTCEEHLRLTPIIGQHHTAPPDVVLKGVNRCAHLQVGSRQQGGGPSAPSSLSTWSALAGQRQ